MTTESHKVYFDHIYVGKANPKWRGKLCRILQTWRGKAKHNVLVQFIWGAREVVPMRCLRKIRGANP